MKRRSLEGEINKVIVWTLEGERKIKFDYYPHISEEIPWGMIEPGRVGWEKELYLDLIGERKESFLKVERQFVKLNDRKVWYYFDDPSPFFNGTVSGITFGSIDELERIDPFLEKERFWLFIRKFERPKKNLPELKNIKKIGFRGGRVDRKDCIYLKGLPFWDRIFWISLGESKLDDKAIEELFYEKGRLYWLGLGSNLITDKGLKFISKIETIRWLGLGNTLISECNFIERLEDLELLWLSSTYITDRSLERIKELKRLKVLGLNNCKIKRIDRLSELKALEVLFINNTFVEDIRRLTEFPFLRVLGLKINIERDKLLSIFELPLYYLELNETFLDIKFIKELFKRISSLKAVLLGDRLFLKEDM